MKYFITLLLISCIASQSLAQEKAKVIFIRETGHFGSAVDFGQFVDGKMVCRLDNKSYNTIEVTPGEHSITWQSTGKELKKAGAEIAIQMDFLSGTTYYFQMVVVKRYAKYEFQLNELTERTALKLMEGLKEDDNCFK